MYVHMQTLKFSLFCVKISQSNFPLKECLKTLKIYFFPSLFKGKLLFLMKLFLKTLILGIEMDTKNNLKKSNFIDFPLKTCDLF